METAPGLLLIVNPVQPSMDLLTCQSCATIHGPTYMSVLCNHPRTYIYVNPVQQPWTYLYVSPVQPSMDLLICQSCATIHGPTDLSVPCNHPSSSDRRSNSHRAVIGDQTLIEQRSEIKLSSSSDRRSNSHSGQAQSL